MGTARDKKIGRGLRVKCYLKIESETFEQQKEKSEEANGIGYLPRPEGILDDPDAILAMG